MSRHLLLFSRLVRVFFPEDFRADYEADMVGTFRAQHRAAAVGGVRAVGRLWWETVVGFVRTGPREHLAQLRQDTGYALRMMRRTPAFTAVACATLAIGIGANTAIFSVVNTVLLRPLPYAHAESLSALQNLLNGTGDFGLSDPELLDARERLRGSEVAAFTRLTATLTGGGEPESLAGIASTANYINVLGVRPVLGRTFQPEEELPGKGRVVLLTHALWVRLFDASADAIGQALTLDGRPHTVVGVLPASYVTPSELGSLQRSSFVLPLSLDPAMPRDERGNHYLNGIVRRRQGFGAAQAQAEVDRLVHGFKIERPGEYEAAYRARLAPLRDQIIGEVRRPLLVLFGAVCLVLLIACANVANLLLARGQIRAREIAVRKALGASQARLVRQVLTESVILAGVAGAAGVLLAWWLLRLIAATAPNIPRVRDVAIDPVVLAFTAAIAVLTAFIFGCLPALQYAREQVAGELRSGRSGRSGMRQGVRGALVTAQVGLALVLLAGAGLLLQSFARLLRVPSGFNAERVLTARLAVPLSGYETREEVVRFFEQVLDGVRSSPGIVNAGAVAGLPLQSGRGDWDVYLEGETPGPDGSNRPADWQVVTPGYFEALGIPLARGRTLAATDRWASPAVVLVNEALARAFFPGEDAVGHQIRMSGDDLPWMTIIGVVGDVRHDALEAGTMPEVYLPHAQFRPFWRDTTMRSFALVVRTVGDPALAAPVLRQQVRALDPSLPVSTVYTMKEVVAESVAERRLHMLLLGFFAAVALVLSVVGTYGVLAYQVTERTREIGVRLALGANAGGILRMVVRDGMTPAVVGVLCGLAGAAGATRLLSSLLFETQPLEPSVFAVTSATLLGAALVACCVPARRATRVDPSRALRAE